MSKSPSIAGIARSSSSIMAIDPKKIVVVPYYNVREAFDPSTDPADKELLHSMEVRGFQSDKPLTVRLNGAQVELVAGHRRLSAALALGVKTVFAVPEGLGDTGEKRTEAERVADLLVSNSGKPLSPAEKGAAFLRLKVYGWKDGEIASKFGNTVKWVQELCKLAKLDVRLRELVKHEIVSPTLAIETAAKMGSEKARAVIVEASKLGTGKKAGRATGATIAAVTGTAAKNSRKGISAADVSKVLGPVVPVLSKGAIVPQRVVHGPFILGKDMDDCTMFDTFGVEMCEFASVEQAKAMLLLVNQGWHAFNGKAGSVQPEPVPPAKAANDTAKSAAPVRAAASATKRTARKRA